MQRAKAVVIVNLYRQNVSPLQIASMLHLEAVRIYDALDFLGATLRPHERMHDPRTQEHKDALRNVLQHSHDLHRYDEMNVRIERERLMCLRDGYPPPYFV